MTRKQAETTANIVLIVAGAAGAYAVLRNPKLRRLVWRVARQYVAGPLAVWGAELVREAWQESGRTRIA